MRYLILLILAGCGSVTVAPELPCDHKNRSVTWAVMPFWASSHVCTELTKAQPYSPACAVLSDSEAVIIRPMGTTEHDAHELLHAKCGLWHK